MILYKKKNIKGSVTRRDESWKIKNSKMGEHKNASLSQSIITTQGATTQCGHFCHTAIVAHETREFQQRAGISWHALFWPCQVNHKSSKKNSYGRKRL